MTVDDFFPRLFDSLLYQRTPQYDTKELLGDICSTIPEGFNQADVYDSLERQYPYGFTRKNLVETAARIAERNNALLTVLGKGVLEELTHSVITVSCNRKEMAA